MIARSVHGESKFGLAMVALAVLVFLLVHNFSFKVAESASSGRVAMLMLFVWAVCLKAGARRRFPSYFFLLFLPLPYVVVQFIFVGDFGQLSRLIHLLLYSFVGAWCVAKLCETREQFLLVLFAASVAQSLIIIFSFVSIDYRAWYEGIVVSGGNFDASYLYRAPGLSGAAGASLSVIQSMGVLAGWVMLKLYRANPRYGFRVWMVIAGMALITLSCVVVGRTGLLLSLIFFGLGLWQLSSRQLMLIVVGLQCLAAYALVIFDLSELLPTNFSMDFFVEWAFGFLSGDDPVLQVLYDMDIPPLNLETFMGTGLVSLVDGANPSGHDSGFVQTYYTMGVPMTVLLYASYLFILVKAVNWVSGWHKLVVVGIFFFLEIKEPFLFKYVTMFVLMTLYLLSKPRTQGVTIGSSA